MAYNPLVITLFSTQGTENKPLTETDKLSNKSQKEPLCPHSLIVILLIQSILLATNPIFASNTQVRVSKPVTYQSGHVYQKDFRYGVFFYNVPMVFPVVQTR